MKKFLTFSLGLSMVFMFFRCEKSSTATVNGMVNTTGESSVGNGKVGNSDDYFYNFENQINVKFNRYDYNTLRLGNFDPSIDTLNFRTFPDFLLQIDTGGNTDDWTHRDLVYERLDTTRIDSVTLSSSQFKNINSMFWDLSANPEFQRYKPTPSSWVYSDSTIVYEDTLDYLNYRSVIDTLIGDGVMFIDTTEWVSQEQSFLNQEKFQFDVTFHFVRRILNTDSLMFRINGDCNDNGVWDDQEHFTDVDGDGIYNSAAGDIFDLDTDDTGNGSWDRAEIYYDTNGNGSWDLNEPFEDRNCNGFRDAAESFTDQNGNGTYDEGEPFVDEGNGMWDGAEQYTDLNQNGAGDPGELYIIGQMPSNLLISYDNYFDGEPNYSDPRILIDVEPGDSVITYWGETFRNIIEEIEYTDSKTRQVDDVDSLVVLTTNQIIETASEQFAGGSHYVTKTQYGYLDQANNIDVREYDYHIYKKDGNIYELVHPSYFYPAGYYFAPDEREDGFWYEDYAVDQVQFYTPGGLFRDGERVETDTTITTSVAVYNVHRLISVDADSVVVPAKKMRGYTDENGDIICYANNAVVQTMNECEPADTTFYDCFKVNRHTVITMIGNGIEYTEDEDIWLVNGLGIAKDDLRVGWTGIDEFDYSILEMVDFREVTSRNLMRNYFDPPTAVNLNTLQEQPGLNNDPYEVHRTAGFHRVVLPNR
ncbi:MAG: hypothetical protein GXO91_00505 [FCB group bacterium]|nr:hypothetical protein [FCB group bacterium]